MTCLLARALDPKIRSLFGPRFESCAEQSFFQNVFFWKGIFLYFKVPGFSSGKVCFDDQHSHGN